MPHWLYILFFFALGACVGSFLNVVVWRLPRGESLVSPPSHCPTCDHRLAWYDNIPVFGWLALRGRCRYCFSPISARYPTVEFITGALFVFYYIMFFICKIGPCPISRGRWFELMIQRDYAIYLLYMFTIAALLAASLIDAELFWIPQSIPIVMAGVGVLYHALVGRPNMPGAINVSPGGIGGLVAVGGTVGLVISLLLLKFKVLPRSFAEGYPALEIEKEEHQQEEPRESAIARTVRRMIEGFRRMLTPQQRAAMEKAQREAAKRDKEKEAEQKAELEKNAPKTKEYTKAGIRREMRCEMLFLMPPIAAAMLMVFLARWSPALAKSWNNLLAQHGWLSGLLGSLLGALVGAFTVWLTRILGTVAFGREAMGMGDVDLMFGVGAIIGAGASVVAFFVAPFFGIALAIYMLIVGKRRELPYGPYLSLGTAFVMLYYCGIAAWLAPGMTMIGGAMARWIAGS